MSTAFPKAFIQRPLAHRALHDAGTRVPECSIAAIDRAIAAGFGIEIDLQLSADDRAMVFHDSTLDRMTDATGEVRARTSSELTGLHLKNSDETIPTLAQVLNVVGGKVPLLIEMKDQSGLLAEGPDDLERAVATDLAGYDGPVAVMSFNPHSVAAFGTHAPNIPRGLVTSAFSGTEWPELSPDTRARLRAIEDFDTVGAQFVSHDKSDLNNPRLTELAARNVPVLCWTVRSPDEEVLARRVADNITFEGFAPTLDPVE